MSDQTMIEELVKRLADPMRYSWVRMSGRRDLADEVLGEMADIGLIQFRNHRYGGAIWTVNGRHYGRTDSEG